MLHRIQNQFTYFKVDTKAIPVSNVNFFRVCSVFQVNYINIFCENEIRHNPISSIFVADLNENLRLFNSMLLASGQTTTVSHSSSWARIRTDHTGRARFSKLSVNMLFATLYQSHLFHQMQILVFRGSVENDLKWSSPGGTCAIWSSGISNFNQQYLPEPNFSPMLNTRIIHCSECACGRYCARNVERIFGNFCGYLSFHTEFTCLSYFDISVKVIIFDQLRIQNIIHTHVYKQNDNKINSSGPNCASFVVPTAKHNHFMRQWPGYRLESIQHPTSDHETNLSRSPY